MSDIFYSGNVQVHLQGNEALLPFETEHKDLITYYIGSQSSSMIIKDHRPRSIRAAHLAISGVDSKGFASIFNQPAFIEVCVSEDSKCEEKVEINLLPADPEDNTPILWMGILDKPQIPVYEVNWEFLKPLNDEQTAFAILVR